jgi:hypothetical protein
MKIWQVIDLYHFSFSLMSSAQASNAYIYHSDDEKYHDNVLRPGAVVHRLKECIKMKQSSALTGSILWR